MRTEEFDFDLPEALIAQHPVEPRDASRLLVVRRDPGTFDHRTFADLPELLDPRDVLARNNTRVVPARLVGQRLATGGAWEGLFLREREGGSWEILAKTRGRPLVGERVGVGRGLVLILEERLDAGKWVVRPEPPGPTADLLAIHGEIPLPPYIRKGVAGEADRSRYQTTFARSPGAVAAPTAGLHFTEALFDRLDARGIARVDLTLHVGLGTFRPIEVEQIDDHALHAEWAEVTPEAAATLNARRSAGGRVVAVGTTSARTLETASTGGAGALAPFTGETALYLKPGHEFRGVDALLTNFHLPRSSLLVLVSAFAGVELIRAAYTEAIAQGYRFYSYGDAMLIL